MKVDYAPNLPINILPERVELRVLLVATTSSETALLKAARAAGLRDGNKQVSIQCSTPTTPGIFNYIYRK